MIRIQKLKWIDRENTFPNFAFNMEQLFAGKPCSNECRDDCTGGRARDRNEFDVARFGRL